MAMYTITPIHQLKDNVKLKACLAEQWLYDKNYERAIVSLSSDILIIRRDGEHTIGILINGFNKSITPIAFTSELFPNSGVECGSLFDPTAEDSYVTYGLIDEFAELDKYDFLGVLAPAFGIKILAADGSQFSLDPSVEDMVNKLAGTSPLSVLDLKLYSPIVFYYKGSYCVQTTLVNIIARFFSLDIDSSNRRPYANSMQALKSKEKDYKSSDIVARIKEAPISAGDDFTCYADFDDEAGNHWHCFYDCSNSAVMYTKPGDKEPIRLAENVYGNKDIYKTWEREASSYIGV